MLRHLLLLLGAGFISASACNKVLVPAATATTPEINPSAIPSPSASAVPEPPATVEARGSAIVAHFKLRNEDMTGNPEQKTYGPFDIVFVPGPYPNGSWGGGGYCHVRTQHGELFMTGTPNDAMPARGVPEYGGPQVMDLTGDGHPELVLVNWRPAYGACGVVDFHVLSDLPTGLVELRVRVSGGVESVPGGAWDSIGLVPPNPNDLDDGEHYVLGGTTCVCSDKDLSCTTGLNHPRQEHVRMKWNGRVFIEASRVREVQQ